MSNKEETTITIVGEIPEEFSGHIKCPKCHDMLGLKIDYSRDEIRGYYLDISLGDESNV